MASAEEHHPPDLPDGPPDAPDSDFQRYLRSTSSASSYFSPKAASGSSIYSFSRTSFSGQLSQLTSVNLPAPAVLEASIAAIGSAPAAARALGAASEQLTHWIERASDVLAGLDAEDDVEWAAAGGRDGLDEVDRAVARFESLVDVYVRAIEAVQLRPDVADIGADSLKSLVSQMEATLGDWRRVRKQLGGVKHQVELAMEWEELWSAVLGDVGLEIENLGRLVFEMEEKRHRAAAAAVVVDDGPEPPPAGFDINELATIVEESPINQPTIHRQPSIVPVLPSPPQRNPLDDSSLLALFARMQPLRASLDFLPMRMSMFQSRAESIFPSACAELEDRRCRLEDSYRQLEADAEALHRELGEDRWVMVFRNAARQAGKMVESVERSINKLVEALDNGVQLTTPVGGLSKKMENFEAKKVHYGPAIARVLAIIQKGVSDRLTINGEVIRLLQDLCARYQGLLARIASTDALLDDHASSSRLRDSVSSSVSLADLPSPVAPLSASAVVDTPDSSPASSVIMPPKGGNNGTHNRDYDHSSSGAEVPRPGGLARVKRYSGIPQATSTMSAAARHRSSLPRPSPSHHPTSTPSAYLTPPPTSTHRLAAPGTGGSSSSRPSSRAAATSRASSRASPAPAAPRSQPPSARPRWNAGPNTAMLDTGHNFKPLSITTPSPYRRVSPGAGPSPASSVSSAASTHTQTPTPAQRRRPSSGIPLRSPLSRNTSVSPSPPIVISQSQQQQRQRHSLSPRPGRPLSRLAVSPTPARTPTPSMGASRGGSVLDPPPYSKLRRPSPATSPAPPSAAARSTSRIGAAAANGSGHQQHTYEPYAYAYGAGGSGRFMGKKSSMSSLGGGMSKRTSMVGMGRNATEVKEEKPRWRF